MQYAMMVNASEHSLPYSGLCWVLLLLVSLFALPRGDPGCESLSCDRSLDRSVFSMASVLSCAAAESALPLLWLLSKLPEEPVTPQVME